MVFIQIRSAAQKLCCTERHIYEMIKDGRLEAVRIGLRGTRVLKASLDNYIETNMRKTTRKEPENGL